MAVWDRFARKKDDTTLHPGRSSAPYGVPVGTTLTPSSSKQADVLTTLRTITDEAKAIDYLIGVSPDFSMAVNTFVRLSNQGHEMYFESKRGTRLPDVEKRWREQFAARVNAVGNSGLDGLIDQLHYSAYTDRGQAVEVVVESSLTDVDDVYPVAPGSLLFKWEEWNGKLKWVKYQRQWGKTEPVCLENANFFWVPTQSKIDDPSGTLLLAPAVNAEDFQMQIRQDLQQVLHNQGWPRYDIEITLEGVLKAMPSMVRADPKKQREWMEEYLDQITKRMRSLNPDDAFVHFDDTKFNNMAGGDAARSLDVRAITEMLDAQTMSGLKQMAVFMNRVGKGDSQTWSTVQFRIFTSMITSIQRGSKRLIENAARIWLQTQGIQAVPHFKHNTIDWQAELEKVQVKLAWEKYWAAAQLLGWISPDDAASKALGVSKATGQQSEQGISVSLGAGGDLDVHGDGPRVGTQVSNGATEEEPTPRRGLFGLFGGRGKGPRGG